MANDIVARGSKNELGGPLKMGFRNQKGQLVAASVAGPTTATFSQAFVNSAYSTNPI